MSSTRKEYIQKYGYDAVAKANGFPPYDRETQEEELRDLFAAYAPEPNLIAAIATCIQHRCSGFEAIAILKYKHADAMLKVRGS